MSTKVEKMALGLVDPMQLFEAASVVSMVIPTRSTNPLLTHMLLRIRKSGITVIGTDLSIRVEALVTKCSIEKDADLLVSSAKMTSVLKELAGDGEIELSIDQGLACISTSTCVFRLATEDDKSYPESPVDTFDRGQAIIKASALSGALARTTFAVSDMPTRYAMNGIAVEDRSESLRFIATDGKRVSVVDLPNPGERDRQSWVVPPKAFGAVTRVVGDGDDDVTIRFGHKALMVEASSVKVFARVIDGNFPPYDTVLPKVEDDQWIRVSRDNLLDVTRRAQVLLRRDTMASVFEFRGNPGTLAISARVQDVGASETSCPFPWPRDRDEMRIGFNPAFIAQALKAMDGAEAEIAVLDPKSPIVLREIGGCGMLYISMPINLD